MGRRLPLIDDVLAGLLSDHSGKCGSFRLVKPLVRTYSAAVLLGLPDIRVAALKSGSRPALAVPAVMATNVIVEVP